jgi:hypothetical protein
MKTAKKQNVVKRRSVAKHRVVKIPAAVVKAYRAAFGGTISPAAMALLRREYRKNPAGAFERCVAEVSKRPGVYSPRGVCATAGRKKYGAAGMAKKAAAGRRRKVKKNQPQHRYDFGPARGSKAKLGFQKKWSKTVKRVKKSRRAGGMVDWDFPSRQKQSWKAKTKKPRRKNPEDAAAERYEFFHGRAPDKVTTVRETVREHSVLSGVGKLARISVAAVDGSGVVELSGFKGALLAQNEAGTQLFIKGGDQRVDLAMFGIKGEPHEVEVLGAVVSVDYDTQKDHLGADGGKARFDHKFGGRGSRLPLLVYDTVNHLLRFAGGGYTLPEVGISG